MTTRPLHDRTAWVTGASRGIGRAIAIALGRAGATVCLGARSADEAAQVVAVLAAEGITAHALPLDVASREAINGFAESAIALAGPPQILVNNAGLGVFKDMEILDPDDFDAQIDVNLRGPWHMAKAALPQMKRGGGGHIINISSIAGRVPFRRGTAYCGAKAGLNSMSEAMMLELHEHGIRVTVIAPGSVSTRFHQQALPGAHHGDQGWMLEPETIAEACLHVLTAPEAALINYYEVRPLRPVK